MIPRNLQKLSAALVVSIVLLSAVLAGLLAFADVARNDWVTGNWLVVFPFLSGLSIGALYAYLLPPRPDPWALQRMLMQKSGQSTPAGVQLNRDTLTYIALIAEETSELLEPVKAVLHRSMFTSHRTGPLAQAYTALDTHSAQLRINAERLRSIVSRLPASLVMHMSDEQAVEFADGCTDLSVVSCGLAVASGVPGAACYEEVLVSNLSKTDPVSGLIEKDSTGKWIKGPNYKAPNLMGVLEEKGAL
jgi:Phosphoribosyl-ATP pyrophosphohydrolase